MELSLSNSTEIGTESVNMNKFVSIIRTSIIAVWPMAFLLMIGPIEMTVRRMIASSFDPKYNIWLAIVYVFSGLVFAVNSFGEKDFFKRKCTVNSHIVAGILVVAFSILWFLFITDVVYNKFIANVCTSTPLNVLSLILGYTLYSTIKAIVLYKNE